MANKRVSPAVAVAKRRAVRDQDTNEPVVLSTGYKARLVPVSPSLIDDAQARIPDPVVPKYYIEEKGREEENPDDPDYKKAVQAADDARARAAIDILVMFGFEMVDGIPEDDRWLDKLRKLMKYGHVKLDLDAYDLEDPIDREFVFKKYVATANPDYKRLADRSGVSEEVITEQGRGFQDS